MPFRVPKRLLKFVEENEVLTGNTEMENQTENQNHPGRSSHLSNIIRRPSPLPGPPYLGLPSDLIVDAHVGLEDTPIGQNGASHRLGDSRLRQNVENDFQKTALLMTYQK